MSQRRLVILVDHVDLDRLEPAVWQGADYLAVTTSAMLALETKALPYLTFEDFYHVEQFRKDYLRLQSETENLLATLDKYYEPFLNFPRAFTGNIYWFFILAVDLYYMSKICDGIKRNYGDAHIIGSQDCGTLDNINPQWNSAGIRFYDLHLGLQKKIAMLKTSLSPQCTWLNKTQRILPEMPHPNQYPSGTG